MTLAQLNIAQKQADEDLVALITKLEGMEPKVLKKRLKLLGLPKLTKLESKVSTSHSESDITATSRQQFGLCPICRLVHPLTSAASMLQAPMGIKKKVFVRQMLVSKVVTHAEAEKAAGDAVRATETAEAEVTKKEAELGHTHMVKSFEIGVLLGRVAHAADKDKETEDFHRQQYEVLTCHRFLCTLFCLVYHLYCLSPRCPLTFNDFAPNLDQTCSQLTHL